MLLIVTSLSICSNKSRGIEGCRGGKGAGEGCRGKGAWAGCRGKGAGGRVQVKGAGEMILLVLVSTGHHAHIPTNA